MGCNHQLDKILKNVWWYAADDFSLELQYMFFKDHPIVGIYNDSMIVYDYGDVFGDLFHSPTKIYAVRVWLLRIR